ncbi:MAG: hypothetical protein AB8H79_21045 [Myxococcota bacterium]
MIFVLFAAFAGAGTGPWTLDAGEHNAYVGVDYGQFQTIGRPGQDAAKLQTGLNAAQVTGVWTAGIIDGVDMELVVPLKRAWATDDRTSFCVQSRPDDWCEPTQGVGNVGLHFRGRLLSEDNFRPITLSARLGLRTGAAYAGQRGRLTTLGDGQTDLGAGLSIGRTGTAGKAWYRVSMAADYWLRFRLATTDGRRVPGDELAAGVDALGSPVPWLGMGVSAAGFHRLWGVGLGDVRLGDRDAWVSLAASHVRVGPKVAFYTKNHWTFFSTVQFTAAAKNAPSDMIWGTVGVGRFFRKPETTE